MMKISGSGAGSVSQRHGSIQIRTKMSRIRNTDSRLSDVQLPIWLNVTAALSETGSGSICRWQTSKNVWNVSLFEHFFKVLSLNWKLGSGSELKVGSRSALNKYPDPHQIKIRIRIRVISQIWFRIRIRITVVQILNTDPTFGYPLIACYSRCRRRPGWTRWSCRGRLPTRRTRCQSSAPNHSASSSSRSRSRTPSRPPHPRQTISVFNRMQIYIFFCGVGCFFILCVRKEAV